MTAILKFIITKLWPILIPLVLYLIWLIYARITHKEGKKPTIGDGHFKQVIFSMLAIAVMIFVYLFVIIEQKDESYVPSTFEDGHLVPSRVERE